MKPTFVLSAGLLLALPLSSSAALIIQELFDGGSQDVTLHGQASNLTSGTGFDPGGIWQVNEGGNTISTAPNFNVDSDPPLPGLSPQQSGPGGIWVNTGGDWRTSIWATRPLASAINFAADRVLYFSVRLNNTGDTAVGFGFSDGSVATSNFVGVGSHWNNMADIGGTEARNSLYSTWGTLDQDLTGNNDGPYAMRAHTPEGSLNGDAVIVGRITLSAAGNDTMDLMIYGPGSTIDAGPDGLTWSLTDSFTSGMSASHLLLWANGSGNGELDAIRVGDSWLDVTGVPEPSAALMAGLSGLGLLSRRRRA